MISARKRKYLELFRSAWEQPSDWLEAALKDKTHNNGRMTPAARLACLHVLTCRDHKIQSPSGLPYPQRKKAVRAAMGI